MRRYLWTACLTALVIILGSELVGNDLASNLTGTAHAQSPTLPEPPREFLNTTYVPPTGNTITVQAGGNLQAALNQAVPGSQIVLQAGATYTAPAEGFVLPKKTGNDWIVIRSSNIGGIPSEGTRITPQHASAMPKIVAASIAPALVTASGAHHYRFIGVEITMSQAFNYGLVRLGHETQSATEVPTDIIVDRCYIHASPTQSLRRGIALNSARTAIIDSYIAGCKEEGADTQAICGWNGPGPFKIVNNYLEGAGENVMFGGADPSIFGLIPSDIEFRRNHVVKPLSWKVGHPLFAGKHWTVKNLFELKNSQRLLIDGNMFENCWLDAQVGYAILLKSQNQDGSAPWSVTRDVTFTNNIVRHAASAFNIAGHDPYQTSDHAQRFLVANNVFDDIDDSKWGESGSGIFFTITDTPDVVVNHNTVIHTGSVIITYGVASPGFAFTNNIMSHNEYGIKGDSQASGNGTISVYFPSSVFRKSVIAGAEAAEYPADNFYLATLGAVGFVDFAGGNYRLAAASPCRNAGTDGRDLGADIDAIEAAMGGEVPPPPPTNQPPQVSIQASPGSGTAPLTVSFTSNAFDPDGQIVAYAWDFGDGQASSVAAPVHLYQSAGAFTARLTVTDNAGAQTSASVAITATTPPPTPAPVVQVLAPNANVTLKAGSSYTVTWSATGSGLWRHDIELSLDDGRTWQNLVIGLPGTGTAYQWKVPSTPTKLGRIRVTSYSAGGRFGSDMSDKRFKIVSLKIGRPAAGSFVAKKRPVSDVTLTSDRRTR